MKIGSRFSRVGLIIFLLGLLTVFTFKAFTEGWLTPRKPLELNDKPALLFFNRNEGCECAMVVYRAAQNQVQNWSDEERRGVQLIIIDLDRRPDLGKKFGVIRAPTLLLLDQDEEIIYRQDEVVTDAEPIHLPVYEDKIAEVLSGE